MRGRRVEPRRVRKAERGRVSKASRTSAGEREEVSIETLSDVSEVMVEAEAEGTSSESFFRFFGTEVEEDMAV